MVLVKVIVAVVIICAGLVGFSTLYGDQAIFSGFKGSMNKGTKVSDGLCLPNHFIGNKYFEVALPKGFCGCLNDGKQAINSGKGLGKNVSETDFISMCFEVYYEKPLKNRCDSINAMLSKSGKKRKLDCSCFSKKVNMVTSHEIATDGLGLGKRFFSSRKQSGDTFERVTKSLSVDMNFENTLFNLPRGVVTSCVK